jgi:hypothetical protein
MQKQRPITGIKKAVNQNAMIDGFFVTVSGYPYEIFISRETLVSSFLGNTMFKIPFL